MKTFIVDTPHTLGCGCEIIDSIAPQFLLTIKWCNLHAAAAVTAAERDNLLAALEAAEAIVTQHNLLSTATREQRSSMIERHIDWWNDIARPVITKARKSEPG